ncbi:MAG: 3-oxoacyl-ACP reductase FabG [Actinomycetota bacterium]|nr:3-oxoacyl-ACP reductase FabG [Actinomycetota bacterium]
MSLSDKTAIVTGASSGLGRASAVALAAEGANVVVAGLEPEGLAATVAVIKEAGGRGIAVEADISDADAVYAMTARAQQEYGGTDILVNNAAIYPYGPWNDFDEGTWESVFNVNVKGYWLSSRAVYPQMIDRGGGSIVNISSITFFMGNENLMPYVASKGAVVGFTRTLAREAGPNGIRVNSIAPGAFPTRAIEIHPDQQALHDDLMRDQSLKRRGVPEDIAKVVVFFAGDQSSFVTGQTLLVDGGLYLH